MRKLGNRHEINFLGKLSKLKTEGGNSKSGYVASNKYVMLWACKLNTETEPNRSTGQPIKTQ
jgi:hypothetical protein